MRRAQKKMLERASREVFLGGYSEAPVEEGYECYLGWELGSPSIVVLADGHMAARWLAAAPDRHLYRATFTGVQELHLRV